MAEVETHICPTCGTAHPLDRERMEVLKRIFGDNVPESLLGVTEPSQSEPESLLGVTPPEPD